MAAVDQVIVFAHASFVWLNESNEQKNKGDFLNPVHCV